MKRVKYMTQAALMAALMTICAWMAIPVPPVSFTLQTLGLCLCLGLLGGKWGSVSIALYLLLGAVGLPVFSGFRGGIATLLGPTGGFLLGFALAGPVYGLIARATKIGAMVAAVAVSYVCGCLWYLVYAPGTSVPAVLLICVAPYLPGELVKLPLALGLCRRIQKHIP